MPVFPHYPKYINRPRLGWCVFTLALGVGIFNKIDIYQIGMIVAQITSNNKGGIENGSESLCLR